MGNESYTGWCPSRLGEGHDQDTSQNSKRLGVDRIIHPEVEIGQHIAQILQNPLLRDYVSVGNGYSVVNVRIPDSL